MKSAEDFLKELPKHAALKDFSCAWARARLLDYTSLSGNGSSQLRKHLEQFFLAEDSLATVFAGKQVEYGDFFKDLDREPATFMLWNLFFDMRRKFTRLRRVLFDEGLSERAACDTLGDLAVYSIMGLLLIAKMKEKEMPTLKLSSSSVRKTGSQSKTSLRSSRGYKRLPSKLSKPPKAKDPYLKYRGISVTTSKSSS